MTVQSFASFARRPMRPNSISPLKNQIDAAIHQLKLCERHGILGRSDVYTFAPPPNDDLQYVVARGPKPET